jgi:hypothetical protein
MEISELTLKIILIFIPGAIASLILDQLTIHKDWSSFTFVIHSIILGLITYLFIQLFYLVPFINPTGKVLKFWQSINDTKSIPFIEILYASIFSVFLGFGITFIVQRKWLFKIARWSRISFKYGDECLYYYFLNAKDLKEVYVRDYDQNLTYHGFIQVFSESDYERELVLTNVDVYRLSDSHHLYNTDAIFISKSKSSNWHIETPIINHNNSKSKKDGKKGNHK